MTDGVRALKLMHMHTGQRETIVFKRDGVYDKDGIARLNYLVRDWRRNEVKSMDPHLYDLLWQVYAASGSSDFIHVVCGYRSPDTNAMLRRRSKGVAQHSQHMLGKAMDFYIPGVPLSKLREIGLRMQIGGVGYYPTSGSPFVHMDTGGVRMWPRMTRDQLVRVFPNGKTLYIPSDGKPLPGYAAALAAYQSRKAGAVVLASVADAGDDGETADEATDRVVKSLANDDLIKEVPMPRLAQRPVVAETAPAVVAMVEAGATVPVAAPAPTHAISFFDRTFGVDAGKPAAKPATARPAILRDVDFDAASDISTPVPTALASAMAARDRSGRSAPASLPIAPTAIVATVDVSRPLRAEAMTTAVLRGGSTGDIGSVPAVMGYAALDTSADKPRAAAKVTGAVIPIPQASPLHNVASPVAVPVAAPALPIEDLYARLSAAKLTLTALDTQALRLWMAGQSTREKRYALLTMPDFAQMPALMDKPTVGFAATFTASVSGTLRTDHFSGTIVQSPAVVDLEKAASVASR
ncbi:MAG TPA: DUF882 domain-containing protein [Bauldia sp.]|nr:DUF882 domain-containing protein [Bauldia sp.]